MNSEKLFYISKCAYKENEEIDVSFLPPMSRRKLSKVDKAALCVMNEVYENSDVKLVFASQYGEFDRLKKLISQYSEENEVSPATFSASVHNSVIGQFSLLNGIKNSYNAMSAGDNTFCAGLIEAAVDCEQNTDVLYCYADCFEPVGRDKTVAFACIVSKKPSPSSSSLAISLDDMKKYNLSKFLEFAGVKK